MGSFWN